MNKLVLVALAGSAAAVYWFGPFSKLDEERVQSFYKRSEHALGTRDAEAACKLYASKVKMTSNTVMPPMPAATESVSNSKEACENVKKFFAMIEDVGHKIGGDKDSIATLDWKYDVQSVEIAPNKRSATTKVTSWVEIGGRFMKINTQSTDRLVVEWGQVKLASSEADTRISFVGAGAGVDFFKK